MYIDHSVYPDVAELPDTLVTDEQKADYVERICGAWDFDVFPEPETFTLLRDWRGIFDQYPLLHSPAYHTFRRIFGWGDMPFPEAAIVRSLPYEILDRLEERDPDPCEQMV